MPGALGTSSSATTITNDAARAMQPDIIGNLRLDQAWGSAQVMAALHNASAGYYSGVPGAINANLTGSQVFGHPGEAWGWAVGGGAKIANFLLPRDKIEFEADYCHGALGYCIPPIVYSNDWVYGGGNTLAMGYSTDGVFNNGGQIQLTRLRPVFKPAMSTIGTRSGGLQSKAVRFIPSITTTPRANSAARLRVRAVLAAQAASMARSYRRQGRLAACR